MCCIPLYCSITLVWCIPLDCTTLLYTVLYFCLCCVLLCQCCIPLCCAAFYSVVLCSTLCCICVHINIKSLGKLSTLSQSSLRRLVCGGRDRPGSYEYKVCAFGSVLIQIHSVYWGGGGGGLTKVFRMQSLCIQCPPSWSGRFRLLEPNPSFGSTFPWSGVIDCEIHSL